MATYPTSLDSFTNPGSGASLAGHAAQHGDVNDAVEALEAKLGIGASAAASASTGQVMRKTASGTAWESLPVSLYIPVGDETTALTTGTAKVTFRMPHAMTLTAVRGSVATAPTGASLLTVDVNEGGATLLSTKLTFDASEKTTTTAATPAVISDSALADDAEITIDIDQIGSTVAGAGLKVWLIGTRP